MLGYDAASAPLLNLCKQISSTSRTRLRILTKLKLLVMRPFLRIWIEDQGLRWLRIMVLVRPVSVKLTNIIYRYSTVLLISFFVITYKILMSGSLNALKVKVCWGCSIGVFELDVSSYLHTNVSIMSLISSSHKYLKYICRGRNEPEQGIKRDKMTENFPNCPNICTKYLLLFKTNFTMNGSRSCYFSLF